MNHAALVTVHTSDRRVSKHYRLGHAAELVKEPGGEMSSGAVGVVAAKDLAGFADLIARLTPTMVLSYGVPAGMVAGDTASLTTKARADLRPDAVARTKDGYRWPDGPGVFLLDYDAPSYGSLTQDELVRAIRAAAPGLADATMLWIPSSSSHITNTATGEDLTGLRGQRLYLLVADASDIERAGRVLFARLWLSGHGRYEVSKSGALLERTLIDGSVFQPNRLDFAAGASCAAPLEQRRGEPFIVAGTTEVVDTRAALPDLTSDEERELERVKREARREVQGEAAEARDAWVNERVGQIAGEGADESAREAARKVAIQAVENGELQGDYRLHVYVDGVERLVSVDDVIRQREAYDGCQTLDPLEPDYDGRRRVGKLYLGDGKANLFSMAHGGKNYRLAVSPELVLDPTDPLPSAKRFIADEQSDPTGFPKLRYVDGEFLLWTGTHYRPIPEAELNGQLYEYLSRAQRWVKDGEKSFKLVPFKPTKGKVGDVRHAVQATSFLRLDSEPAWLEPRAVRAEDLLACDNGLVHLPTRTVIPHTPKLYNRNAVPYGYDIAASVPSVWLAFLKALWPNDPESIETLQEVFGYLLTGDTAQQKIILLIGPKRSGKGTIGRVLTALLGARNVANPTLGGLGSNFGLAPLIGKRLALIADARLGGRADQAVVAERLLSISGEDAITIDRKHLDAWTGRLSVRFVILTNELPRIADASGALAGRFVVLQLTKSFYGQEDHGLSDRLTAELPSILNWSLDGLARLRQRGAFTQPAASASAVEQLADLGSPIAAFVEDCCELAASRSVPCEELFNAWRLWCEEQGSDSAGTLQSFGRDLLAACAGLRVVRPRDGESRRRCYQGIGLAATRVVRDGPRSKPLQEDFEDQATERQRDRENRECSADPRGPSRTGSDFARESTAWGEA